MGKISKDELCTKHNFSITDLNIELTMLEMTGEIYIDNNGLISLK